MNRTLNNRIEKKIQTTFNIAIFNIASIRFITKILVYIIDLYVYLKLFLVSKKSTLSNDESTKFLRTIYFNEKEFTPLNRGNEWNKRNDFDLTIIIPCYNVENFVFECLSSLNNLRTERRIEIIIIDDGSTDNTFNIIENMKLPENCSIIRQENTGLSGARNTGIEASNGQYITFLDSDDVFIDNNLIKILEIALEGKYDLVDGAYAISNKKYSSKILNITNYENTELDLSDIPKDISGYVWGRIYHRKLWGNTQSPMGFWYEDTQFLFSILPQIIRYKRLNCPIINYRINPSGITESSRGNVKSLDTLYVVDYLVKERKYFYNDLSNLSEIILVQLSSVLLRRIKLLDKTIKENAFIKACNYIDKYDLKVTSRSSFYHKELLKAFKNKDFGRWLLLSKYL